MRWHRLFLGLSFALVVVSLLSIASRGFNLGIDFAGGLLLDIKTEGPADLVRLRGTLGGLGLGDVSLQEFGSPDNVLIRVPKQPGGDAAQQAAIAQVRDALGMGVEIRRVEVVGPQVSAELIRNAIYATISALLAIMAYLWFRFEWQFGVAGVISLIHDVIYILGVFSLFGLDFDLTIVAAVMTIAGYSINDSVVVFDRVRENMRKYKTMPLDALIDLSINQTLSRTFITGVTTILVLLALYVLGGPVLRGFSFAMLFGVIIGTYSSVFVAVPLLRYLNLRRIGERSNTALAETP
ncbi:MAG: protein translocase subunit SecF [Rhodospirillales bacterium]|nr:protein translocase subunit SecF [Rhodospirillales bacterium]